VPALGNNYREGWMAPILISALVGVGMKIVMGLLGEGAKAVLGSTPAGQSFSAALDRASSSASSADGSASPRSSGGPMPTGAPDRAQVLAMDARAGQAITARSDGIAAYRLFGVEAP
jgi:hypothetical protein